MLLLSGIACTHPPSGSSVSRFSATECPSDVEAGVIPDGSVTCGYLTVPENRNDPGGETIQLFVARFRPPGAIPGDPLLVVGGNDLGQPVHYADDISVVQRRVGREVIVLDPRGTGHDKPSLSCPEVDRLDSRFFGASLLQATFGGALEQAVRTCHERLQDAHVDVAAYNISESAADTVFDRLMRRAP